MVSDGLLYPFDFLGNKKKLWALIPRHLIGATQHCTLGNCKWSIVLIDESVPERHDLIPSLGRGPEQRMGRRVENTPYTDYSMNIKPPKNVFNSVSASYRCLQTI